MPVSDKMMERIQQFAREEEERQQDRMQQREFIAEGARARAARIREQELRGVRETPGRVGMVSPEQRSRTRRSVVGQDFLPQMGMEMAPASIGAGAGALAGGAIGGPIGAVAGAAGGGTLGELLGQETGVTPESDAGLALAAGAPVAGPAAGKAVRLLGRGVKGGADRIPMVREARGIRAQRDFAEVRDNFGARTFAKQKGMMATPSRDLFNMLQRADPALAHNQIVSDSFKGSFSAIKDLRRQMNQLAEFPEGRQAQQFLTQTERNLQRGDFDFDRLLNLRSFVGRQMGSNNPEISQSAGRLYRSLSKDLDGLADSARPSKGFARLAQNATKRAKLEFAVQDMEQGISRHLSPLPGDTKGSTFDVAGFRKWLMDKTNPKSGSYDKNFIDAIGEDELDAFKSQLSDLHKIADDSRVGGPGSLVVQGIAATTGGGIGYAIAGAPGATLGGLAGVSGPKMLTAALANPKTAKALKLGAKMGKGKIPAGAMATASEIIAQSTRSRRRQEEETLALPEENRPRR